MFPVVVNMEAFLFDGTETRAVLVTLTALINPQSILHSQYVCGQLAEATSPLPHEA